MKGCGDRQVRMDETNNFKQGRSDSKCKVLMGPAAGKKPGNPTSGGGINRSTKGTAQD